MRTGWVCSGENTSRMPPRIEYSPDHFDRIAAFIADAFEVRGQIVQRHFVVHAERLRQLPVIRGGLGARERGGNRRERDPFVAVRELRERGGAGSQNLGVRRHVLARQDVQRGQKKRGIRRSVAGFNKIGKGLEQGKKRFGLFIAIHHNQLRASGRVMQQDGINRFGRQRQPGETERGRRLTRVPRRRFWRARD